MKGSSYRSVPRFASQTVGLGILSLRQGPACITKDKDKNIEPADVRWWNYLPKVESLERAGGLEGYRSWRGARGPIPTTYLRRRHLLGGIKERPEGSPRKPYSHTVGGTGRSRR